MRSPVSVLKTVSTAGHGTTDEATVSRHAATHKWSPARQDPSCTVHTYVRWSSKTAPIAGTAPYTRRSPRPLSGGGSVYGALLSSPRGRLRHSCSDLIPAEKLLSALLARVRLRLCGNDTSPNVCVCYICVSPALLLVGVPFRSPFRTVYSIL